MSSKRTQKKPASLKISRHQKSLQNLGYSLIIVIAVIFYFYTQGFKFIQDDSFITYRYVENFTEGNGLVFNIGENVEGYTCFLWVISLSLIKILGFNLISASQTLGIIFSILTLFFTYKISYDILFTNKEENLKLIISLAAPALLLSNGAFAYWAVSGMETGLFALLTTIGIYLYLKEFRIQSKYYYLSSIILLLASLTRPEGNLVFGKSVV